MNSDKPGFYCFPFFVINQGSSKKGNLNPIIVLSRAENLTCALNELYLNTKPDLFLTPALAQAFTFIMGTSQAFGVIG